MITKVFQKFQVLNHSGLAFLFFSFFFEGGMFVLNLHISRSLKILENLHVTYFWSFQELYKEKIVIIIIKLSRQFLSFCVFGKSKNNICFKNNK